MIRIFNNPKYHPDIIYSRKPDLEGFDSETGFCQIGKIEGHPYDSMMIVCTSVFGKLEIPAEHKYKLLKQLPRPGMKEPGLVAFYPNDEKREKQLLTVIKPGRYLRKYLVDDNGEPLYSDTQIEEWANQWITEYSKLKVVLLSKSTDIVNAYTESGLRSCMSHETSSFASYPHHPCAVYGEGYKKGGYDEPQGEDDVWIETDTRLAVIYKKDEEEKPENIIARCVVWPEKKVRASVYGDYHKLTMLLDAQGYDKDGEFTDARMRRLENDNGQTVCPYFDFGCGVSVSGDHIIADPYGEGGENQNGLMISGCQCQDCGGMFDEDDMRFSEWGDRYCDECYYEHFWWCPIADKECNSEDRILINGSVNFNYFRVSEASEEGIAILMDDNKIFYCNCNHEYYSCSVYDYIVDVDGETYESESFFETMNGFQCAFTEEFYSGKDYKSVILDDETIVVHHSEAGYDVDEYIEWLKDNDYYDEEFKEELEKQEELL